MTATLTQLHLNYLSSRESYRWSSIHRQILNDQQCPSLWSSSFAFKSDLHESQPSNPLWIILYLCQQLIVNDNTSCMTEQSVVPSTTTESYADSTTSTPFRLVSDWFFVATTRSSTIEPLDIFTSWLDGRCYYWMYAHTWHTDLMNNKLSYKYDKFCRVYTN